jgi:hypothetical protein
MLQRRTEKPVDPSRHTWRTIDRNCFAGLSQDDVVDRRV